MKTRNLLLSVLMLAGLSLQAQNPIEIKVWPDGAPNSNGITEDESLKGPGRPTNVKEPVLYVFPAAKPNGMAVIACPGGGYVHLSMQNEGFNMADWFNAQGITYAVLKYRMPNGHKEVPLSDAQEAIRIVKAHASEWNVDVNRIGIMGASAGGHLASTAATHFTAETRPAFQILLYPVICYDPAVSHKGSFLNLLGKNPSPEDIQLYSNDRQVTTETPPAFIVLASDDTSVPPANSLRYYEALIKNNVQATMHIYPTGKHGFGFKDSFPYKRQWTEELEKWLRELYRQ